MKFDLLHDLLPRERDERERTFGTWFPFPDQQWMHYYGITKNCRVKYGARNKTPLSFGVARMIKSIRP